jgi:hypothetical protein
LIGRLVNEATVRRHLSSGDRGLRTRAALEKTALDQKAIGALSFDHGDPGVHAPLRKQRSGGRAATL